MSVHKQYPTPAEINQAYAAALPSDQHPLVAVLTAVEAGLANPTNHYLINTTEVESPAGFVLLGMLHLQADNTRNLVVQPDGFLCSILFDPSDRGQWSTVRVAFDRVWQVLRSDSPQVNLEEVEEVGGLLYDASEVLSAYAQQGWLA